MALRQVSSFRASAMMTTLYGLPAARRRSRMARSSGIVAAGHEGGEVEGAADLAPPEGGDGAAVELAELGQPRGQHRGDRKADTGGGAQQRRPVGEAPVCGDLGFDFGLKGGAMAVDRHGIRPPFPG